MLEYVAVLDLPKGSLIGLDGYEIQIQRDDFVGFVDFPVNNSKKDSVSEPFHWLTIRASARQTKHHQIEQHSPITVGFYLSPSLSQFLARYDPHTEEVSSETVDDTTRANLSNQIRNKTIDPNRILSYDQVVSTESKIKNWKKMTQYLSCFSSIETNWSRKEASAGVL